MPDLLEPEKYASFLENVVARLPQTERANAREILNRGNAESLELLCDLVSNEQAKRRISSVRIALLGALLLGIALAAVPFFNASGWLAAIALLGGGVLLVVPILRVSPTNLEEAALETALHSEDMRSMGALLKTVALLSSPTSERTKAKLIRLLPQLTPESFESLTPTQRATVHGLMNYNQRDSDLDLRLAVLAALQQAGGHACLGTVYLLATGEAATPTARTVREAARTCVEHLLVRLEFGHLEDLPQYIDNTCAQMQQEAIEFHVYATCALTLRQLLPQLTSANYRSILSVQHRSRLYGLLVSQVHSYGSGELHLEIVRTAERLGDTCAVKALRTYIHATNDGPVKEAVRQAMGVLEPLVEREKESKTLLRGTSAPAAQPGELLRAAAPAESATAPNELLRASIPKQECAPVRANLTSEESSAVLLQRTEDPGR